LRRAEGAGTGFLELFEDFLLVFGEAGWCRASLERCRRALGGAEGAAGEEAGETSSEALRCHCANIRILCICGVFTAQLSNCSCGGIGEAESEAGRRHVKLPMLSSSRIGPRPAGPIGTSSGNGNAFSQTYQTNKIVSSPDQSQFQDDISALLKILCYTFALTFRSPARRTPNKH
jgi:hypothetical protein